MVSFDDFFNMRKNQIAKMCIGFNDTTNNHIEYEDLFQEASLKLFELYQNKKPLDVNFTLRTVRNHLIDYVKKNSVNQEIPVGLKPQKFLE